MELDEVIKEAARCPKVTTFVDYNFRYAEGFTVLLRTLGGRDRVKMCRIRLLTSKPTSCIWGLHSVLEAYLFAVGIHAVEQACYLLGSPLSVDALLVPLSQDIFSVSAVIRFAGERYAVLDIGNYSNRLEYSCELIMDDLHVGLVQDFTDVQIYAAPNFATSAIDSSVGKPLRPLQVSPKEVVHYDLSGLSPGHQVAGYRGAFDAFLGEVRGENSEASSPIARSRDVYIIINNILAQAI